MCFDFSVGFVNVSEEVYTWFDAEHTTEQRGIAVVYSFRKVQYAIRRLVSNEHVSIGWNTGYVLFIFSTLSIDPYDGTGYGYSLKKVSFYLCVLKENSTFVLVH